MAKSKFSELSQEKRVLALLMEGEKQLKWRIDIQKLFEEMKKYSDREEGEISARQLDSLRSSIQLFTQTIVPSLDKYRGTQIDFLDPDNIIVVDSNKESLVNFKFSRLMGPKGLRASRNRIRQYRKIVTKVMINPYDIKGEELLNDLLFQVSARILSLENISLGLIPFIEHERFRYVLINDLKDSDSSMVEDVWHNYINTLFKSDTLQDLIQIIDKNRALLEEKNSFNGSLFTLLDTSRTSAFVREKVEGFTFFKDMMATMKFMAARRWDAFKNIGVQSLYLASKAFGNTVGLVQSRKGLLYTMSKKEENEIAKQMRPLDVIFEKTPFRLTDMFIPGHYGHNAIWSGTEEELKAIGVWDELPGIFMNAVENYGYQGTSFQADIRNGARIIEALRPGVQINSLRHFLDIDDFAVMRAQECDEWQEEKSFCLSPKIKREYLIKAFSQIGKDYDFAFDVNTEDTIVCSELLYRTYLDIDFETTYTVGSYNISPDQVAYQGDEEGDIFTPVILYHDGKKINDNLREYFYNLLHSEEIEALKNVLTKDPQWSNK